MTCRRGEQEGRQQCRPRSPRHPLLLAENANYGDEMKPNIVVNHTSNLGVKSIKMLRDSKCHWFSHCCMIQQGITYLHFKTHLLWGLALHLEILEVEEPEPVAGNGGQAGKRIKFLRKKGATRDTWGWGRGLEGPSPLTLTRTPGRPRRPALTSPSGCPGTWDGKWSIISKITMRYMQTFASEDLHHSWSGWARRCGQWSRGS